MNLKKQLVSEISANLLIPIVISLLLGFNSAQTILLIIGSILIDIDHLFYYFFSKHPKNIKSALQFFKQEFKNHNPHFYIFHNFEVLFILLTLSYLFGGLMFYLFLGFLVNFIIDIFTYLYFYKSTSPWLRYFSLTLSSLV